MRDPTSTFTFTNYLHSHGRLASFINKENQVPSRREWSAYLAWAASRMEAYASYDQEVISIEPVHVAPDSDEIVPVSESSADAARFFKIKSRTGKSGQVTERLARNVTIAVGGQASIPIQLAPLYPSNPWTAENAQVIHSSTFLPSLAKIDALLKARIEQRLNAKPAASGRANKHPLRLAVFGSGQSSAEMAVHLYNAYPQAKVTMIFRASAIVPSDDSAFVNAAAFDPDRTDAFWKATEQQRSEWRKEFRRTNYSVVRPDVLNAIHTIVYDQQIELPAPFPGAAGPSQGLMEIQANTEVISAELVKGAGGEDEIELSLSDNKITGKTSVERFDALFLGTGFNRSPKQLECLRPLAKFYPALDPSSTLQTALSGTSTPDRTPGSAATYEGTTVDDEETEEEAAERLRERQRGITRDYRLVSYADAAFSNGSSSSSSASSSAVSPLSASSPAPALAPAPAPAPPARRRSEEESALPSSSSYSRSSSVGGLSVVSSTSTLNNPADTGGTASHSNGVRAVSTGGRLSHREAARAASLARPNLYLMGCNEATHGLSDSLLSIVAFRAGEITQSLIERTVGAAHAVSAVEHSSGTNVNVKGSSAGKPVFTNGFATVHEGIAAAAEEEDDNNTSLLKQASLKANATLHRVTDQLQRLQSSVTVTNA